MVEGKCVTGGENGVRDEGRGDTERDRERGEEGDGVRKRETKRARGRVCASFILQVMVNNNFNKSVVPVIAGLSNTYSSYITTYYEYQVQEIILL